MLRRRMLRDPCEGSRQEMMPQGLGEGTQSWTEFQVVKAGFIQDGFDREKRPPPAIEPASVPNITGRVEIYSQGAGWGP